MKTKDEQQQPDEELRGLVLRSAAAFYTHGGVYWPARWAAGERTIKDMVFQLGRTVANNAPMTIHERIFLSHLLNALAEGFDVTKELRIDRRKDWHNPSQGALNTEIVHELERRAVDGKLSSKDFADVAGFTGKTATAVRGIWQRAAKTRKVLNSRSANVHGIAMK